MSKASNTVDIDAAKDRLVDSLSTARDITRTAVVDEIAPAVASAFEAAREASGPVYAEAASRASDAVSALRGSDAAARAVDAAKTIRSSDAAARAADAAKSLRNSEAAARAGDAIGAITASDAVQSLRKNKKSTKRKLPRVAAVIGVAAVGYSVVKRKKNGGASSYATYAPRPTEAAAPTASEPIVDVTETPAQTPPTPAT